MMTVCDVGATVDDQYAPASPHSPMIGAFPPFVVLLLMRADSRCSMVVFANAVYWAAVEKLEPPNPLNPVSYL